MRYDPAAAAAAAQNVGGSMEATKWGWACCHENKIRGRGEGSLFPAGNQWLPPEEVQDTCGGRPQTWEREPRYHA